MQLALIRLVRQVRQMKIYMTGNDGIICLSKYFFGHPELTKKVLIKILIFPPGSSFLDMIIPLRHQKFRNRERRQLPQFMRARSRGNGMRRGSGT